MINQELTDYLEAMEKRIKEYTDERSRDIETTLLREFRKWGTRIEVKSRVHGMQLEGLETRMTLVEERLDALDQPEQH